MEYEKPPNAPVFSRKLRNRSHSLSFSANVAYDGVFASPATKKPPPAIDYGEIFRGSGPSSSSSIPFLDVPELYEEKVKVDIRSFKLDYSSVFGGFEGCDFTVSPEELITKPERKRPAEDKRNVKKSGNSSDFPPSTRAKHHISSPEVDSMKQSNASYHQSAPRDEKGINGKTQIAPVQVQPISGYTQLVDNPCPLPKVESRTPISSVEKESCNKGSVKVTYCNNTQVDIPSSHGLRKQNSNSEAEFEIIFGRNGSNMSDSFTGNICRTDPNVKQPDLTPPSSLQHSIHGDKEASERSLGLKSGVSRSFRYEDVHSPCSPPYFDEETDANSAAAASSAALKRALEEAQLRINIAKQMMEKKKVGFRGPAKPRSSDSLKAKDKGNRKLERQTEKYRDSETKSVGELVNSSKQTFSLEGGRVLGELVNYSEQSLPNVGKRNVGEMVNSFGQSFPNMGAHIVEVLNSSNQSSPNARRRNAGAVNSSEQLFPDKKDQNIGEAVNSSEQLFPDKKDQNIGEAVNSSQQPILNGEEQNVCEVGNPYEQSILSGKELNVSKAVNSSEHSSPQKGEQNVGEEVNSSEQLLPHKGEPNIGEAVNSSEQLIPNGGEQNVCELMNSSEQSIPNAGEGNVSEAVNSSEQLFPNVGEKTVGEVARSSKQSSVNVGKRNAGEVVNSSEQLSPEQNIGEMVISSEQLIPNKGEQNVGEALNSSEQSIPEAEEQNVGEVVISSEQSFPSKEEKNVSEVVDSSEQSFSNKGERNLGAIPDEGECNVGEVEISSKQSSLDQGEQQVKRARRLWEVPGGLLKSTLHHMQVEAIEREVIEEEEEHARKARKYWELPGGIFKSNEELQGVTQNSFYSFGQLGNKLKCVVEAFTGNKGPQTSEAEGTEHVAINSHEKSNITPEVRDQEEERMVFYGEEILVDSSDTEICQREVEEILKPIDGQSSTQSDENAESTMCEELKWNEQSENASEAYNAPLTGVNETHENFNLIHEILDQDCEKESLSEPQEMLVGPVDTKTYEREVEEIQQGPNQSMRKSQVHENVGPMESILAENDSVSGHVPEGNENEHKIPRRRRAWKASEDVYDMIKGLKRYNRAWHLDDEEKEMMKRCLREQSASVDDAIDDEETEIISELPTDSGLQENWNVLKQMFRQMFQTVDTKREDGVCCLVESDQNQIDIHKSAEDMDRNGTAAAGTSNYEAYGHNSRENVDLELALKAYCSKEEGEVEEQNRSSFVYELIGEELDAIELANNREMEDVSEVSEADEVDQGAYGLKDMKKQAETHAGVLEHDQSETCSSNSDEKLDQKPCKEQAEETKICSEIDDDLRGPLLESGHGDSDIEEFSLEHKLYDGCSENAGSTSSMEECVEEVDSESNKNGLYVDDMEFIGDLNENSNSVASQSPCLPEVVGNTKQSFEDNEGMTNHEYPEDFGSKSNMEAAAPFSCSSKEDEEKVAAADKTMEESNREYSSRLSVKEEIGATTTDASQNKAEPAEKHKKMMDETKEKEKEREKERIMVERAIREARERAFVEARERAERAAMEKANTRAHRRTTSEVRGRSERASVEANDKLSSSEKASMQAKLRAERAAVERALNEARERALEKALSGKAASQTRSQVGKSSGERRGSSSGAENRSSAPPSSSNPSGHGEPAQRCKSRSERHQRTAERAAKALAEKKLRDLIAQKEQAERNRLAETLDAEVKRWSNGKEGNLRALLSTLQYILGPESGWKPIHLTDLVSSAAVRKAYRKATLYVHPDKLQQRGAATQQKYICEKVFDLLKEAWNRFSAEER